MTIHEKLDEIQKSIKAFGEFQQEFADAFKNFCAISSMMTKNMMSVILTNMTQDDRERYENMLDQINEMYEDEELNSEWEEFPNNDSEE